MKNAVLASRCPARRPSIPMARRRTLRAILCAVAAGVGWSPGGALAQAVPPHLDILSAVIREVPPLDPRAVGARTVVVELTLAGAPTCTPADPFQAYGVLIDADMDPSTGLADPAFAPLGVDARISADCDAAAGQFVSGAGSVTVAPGPGGGTVVSITTTVAGVPDIEFHYVAFAKDDTDLTRLPASPERGSWAIIERRIP